MGIVLWPVCNWSNSVLFMSQGPEFLRSPLLQFNTRKGVGRHHGTFGTMFGKTGTYNHCDSAPNKKVNFFPVGSAIMESNVSSFYTTTVLVSFFLWIIFPAIPSYHSPVPDWNYIKSLTAKSISFGPWHFKLALIANVQPVIKWAIFFKIWWNWSLERR